MFETAADAIISGDAKTLAALLRADPELVRARSTREHASTLLHYVSANGVEDVRQKTPANIVEIAGMLLDAGADVNAESNAYGGRATTLGLTATSCQPEKAGVQIALMELLLERGAAIDEPGGERGWIWKARLVSDVWISSNASSIPLPGTSCGTVFPGRVSSGERRLSNSCCGRAST